MLLSPAFTPLKSKLKYLKRLKSELKPFIPLQLFSEAKQNLPIPLLALAAVYFCVFL